MKILFILAFIIIFLLSAWGLIALIYVLMKRIENKKGEKFEKRDY